MRGRAGAALAAALTVLLCGCVYYNGMYNTKRLAGSARKAERDGRTFEANNFWGQVITRAESLVTRHPDSKYVDEALVLKGLALSRLRQCDVAVTPLARVSLLPRDADVIEEASLALGRCQLELGDPALAEIMFARVAESRDPALRSEARVLRGRALRLSGRPEEGLTALEGVADPEARTERLFALAAAHRRKAALVLVDSLLAESDSVARWDTMAAAVGRADALTASGVVDRVIKRPGIVPQIRAMLLLDDGLRLAGVDSARSEARLRQAAAQRDAGDFASRAQLALLRQQLSRSGSVAELRAVAAELDKRADVRGAGAEAAQLREQVGVVLAASDSVAAGGVHADLRLFLAAEAARDSLAAPQLAASLFRTIVETIPESPYAPKAILAGKALDPVWGVSAASLLEGRYALSPYVAYMRGEEPYGYQELEDSLQVFARGLEIQAGRRDRVDSLPRQPGRPGQAPPRRRELEP
jgi:hypothetical protein